MRAHLEAVGPVLDLEVPHREGGRVEPSTASARARAEARSGATVMAECIMAAP
jgi:hypothetical protein